MRSSFVQLARHLARWVTRRRALKSRGLRVLGITLCGLGSLRSAQADATSVALPDSASAKAPKSIPWSQLGAKAGADYKGDGLSVSPTANGARLRCAFQRLEGEATPEGLWLSSTVTNGVNDRFRIVAAAVGRVER